MCMTGMLLLTIHLFLHKSILSFMNFGLFTAIRGDHTLICNDTALPYAICGLKREWREKFLTTILPSLWNRPYLIMYGANKGLVWKVKVQMCMTNVLLVAFHLSLQSLFSCLISNFGQFESLSINPSFIYTLVSSYSIRNNNPFGILSGIFSFSS